MKTGRIAMMLYRDEDLTEAMRAQMWELYAPHHHATREEFDARWGTLDHVAVFECAHKGDIVGMVGMRYQTFYQNEKSFKCLYFGQVFIESSYRNRMLIQRLVTLEYLKHKLTSPQQHMMFWSDSLTYRPHLLMMNYLNEYYPHPSLQMPVQIRALLTQIGQHYYGKSFDPTTCTVKKSRRMVKDDVARISARELEHPGIKFYVHCNPLHNQGHGLLIMCPLTMHNLGHFLVQATRKMLRSRMTR